MGTFFANALHTAATGCAAAVMFALVSASAADDGAEGYASNRLTRKGTRICHDVNPCGQINTDQFFATDSYRIHAGGKARLREFFKGSTAFAFTIVGHTDSRASHAYNQRLSYNRAVSVARVAASVGAKIVDVRGMGETAPVASNRTREGMARNRRVEILCFQKGDDQT